MNRSMRCEIFSILGLIFFAGCASSSPPTPTVTRLSCEVPTIRPQPETKESQDKGGLQISMAPVAYTAGRADVVNVQQIEPPMGAVIWSGTGDRVYVRRTTRPVVAVNPDHIQFLVKVNNKMPRVFRGAGTVVQFNVGGRLQAVEQGGYSNLLGAIVPPRQEQQIEIIGPPLSALGAKKGTVGVFLYDVVTDQSDAGVVTAKQNFEWYFDYTIEPRQVEAEGKTEEGWMSIPDFQAEIARENQAAAQKMMPPGVHLPPYGPQGQPNPQPQ